MPAKRKSAFFQSMQEKREEDKTVTPSESETVRQSESETVTPSGVETAILSDAQNVPPSHLQTAKTPEVQTVPPSHPQAVSASQSVTVRPSDVQTVKTKDGRKDFPEKVSFYLTTPQLEKLDDLVYSFSKRHKVRINRNQIVRHLIDLCNLDTLETLDTSEE